MFESAERDELQALRRTFYAKVRNDQRVAAETAYALAFRYRNADVDGARRFDIAGLWARRALELLDDLRSDTLDQVASTQAYVGGIPIPDLLHAGVVRDRLADVLT